MNDANDQPLRPAAFDPRPAVAPGSVDVEVARKAGASSARWLLPGLGAAVIALLLVVFLLPALVGNAPSPNGAAPPGNDVAGRPDATGADKPGTAARPSEPAADDRAPFAEAQASRERRAAQEALQLLLELQETLMDRGVDSWAADDYGQALARAADGDAAYRERDFAGALTDYQAATEQLVTLETSIPERIEGALQALADAVEAGDAPAASDTVARLERLAPDRADIDRWRQRIAAIPEVARLLTEAEAAHSDRDYAAAVTAAEAAARADPEHQRAAALLTDYRQSAADARFRAAMSAGYLALEEARFDAADRGFRDALGIRPGAAEPTAALEELATARTASELRRLQQRGQQLEAEEAWADAVTAYEQAASIDATVIFARDGLARARPRAELAAALDTILAERDRLVDTRILREAEATVARAQAIVATGPVLEGQIRAVEAALDYARTPVAVTLTSDGLTDVTLLRVRRLGRFATEGLELRPGEYTAVGIRDGFRDVRVSFILKPGPTPTAVDVRCTEAI